MHRWRTWLCIDILNYLSSHEAGSILEFITFTATLKC